MPLVLLPPPGPCPEADSEAGVYLCYVMFCVLFKNLHNSNVSLAACFLHSVFLRSIHVDTYASSLSILTALKCAHVGKLP